MLQRRPVLQSSTATSPSESSKAPCPGTISQGSKYADPSCSRIQQLTAVIQVVVLTNTTLSQQLEIDDFTHASGIQFISADIHGLFGSVFCDFGPKFAIIDTNGEQPLSGMVVDVESVCPHTTRDDGVTDRLAQSAEGLVTTLDETRHGLEDGDYVTFTEVKGMEGLNASGPRKVTVKGPYTFTIGDTTSLGTYKTGGLFHQAKMPKVVEFVRPKPRQCRQLADVEAVQKPLRQSLAAPEFLMSDFAKFDRPATLHAGFQALSAFREKHNRLPRPRNEDDAAEVVALSKTSQPRDAEVDEKVLKELSYQAQGELAPIAAVMGGYVAQEVLKACSGKFHPTFQHLYFDALEALPTAVPSEADVQPVGSRYDHQIAVFGKTFQDKIANYREFLVGAGAIGCEMLKNWAMMGLATGPKGAITVTDMDSIEKSNLNRQFLFRPRDLGSFKSEAAPRAVTEMNPDLKGKITSLQEAVGEKTEHIFGDEFFDRLDGVTNALDNVAARQYVDRRCVYYTRPLLESGTLGTKANVQVVLPHLTESYSSSHDPPEKEAPMCTVKSFPNIIEHTIQVRRFPRLGFPPLDSRSDAVGQGAIQRILHQAARGRQPVPHRAQLHRHAPVRWQPGRAAWPDQGIPRRQPAAELQRMRRLGSAQVRARVQQ